MLRSCNNNFPAFFRLRNEYLNIGKRRGFAKVVRFYINESQERDCLVPIGDEDFVFRGNAVAGEHLKQVVTVKAGTRVKRTKLTTTWAGEHEVEGVRGPSVVADEGGGALGAFRSPLS